MPVKSCTKDGESGFKWGDEGVCFTGSDARERAAEVGRAIHAEKRFTKCEEILKVDEELGLVFGWGIICKINGEEYFDVQGHNIPEQSMLEAVTDFAKSDRTAGDMHVFQDGTVVHEFPLTAEIAKAFDITCPHSGWMVAVEPSKEVLQKFKDGTYTGFSIGGTVIEEIPFPEEN